MNSNLNVAVGTIFALNLDPIKAKLMHEDAGEGWSRERVDAVELEYRRFLSLSKLFPDEQVAPLFDVDIFWHYHILDTMKYAVDCKEVFGYFLHHFPYSGLRGEDDASVHEQISARTQKLYEATFGDVYMRLEAGTAETQQLEAAVGPAFCQPTTAKAAFCQPTMAKAAFCQPTTAKTAFCQPATAKTVFCQPATAKTVFCQPMTAKVASPHAIAQNDRFYLTGAVSEEAITAMSSQAQTAGSVNTASPVLEYAA